jgi:hypothetical protein
MNLTWNHPGLNPGLWSEKPESSRMNYDSLTLHPEQKIVRTMWNILESETKKTVFIYE